MLRGLPSVAGGMLSYADVARVDGGYVMVLLTESHPAAGYVRSIAQAQSRDGVHWSVVSKDVATLKTTDEDKGTYGVSVAVDPMTGAIQVWLAASDGEGRLAIRYGRWEQ